MNIIRLALLFIFFLLLITPAQAITIDFTNPTPENNSLNVTRNITVNTTTSGGNTSLLNWNGTLIAWYRMNEAAGGTNVEDFSGKGNNGTWNGNTTSNVTSAKFGNALNFDGSNDYVAKAPIGVHGLSSGTLSLWFKTSNQQTSAFGRQLLSLPYDTTGSNGWDIGIDADGTVIRTGLKTSNEVWSVASYTVTYYDNNWHNVVSVYNGSFMDLYFDGVKRDSIARTGTISVLSDELNIARFGSFGNYFNATIDEVRIYNRALSQEEINASYDATLYRLRANFTNLADGTYNFTAYIQDTSGTVNQTEKRFVTVETCTYCVVATDGSGDYNVDGTDDQTEINNAISGVNALGGGTVHLKNGTFKVKNIDNTSSGKFAILYPSNAANITFEGENNNTVIRLQPGTNGSVGTGSSMMYIYGTNNTIRNLVLDGNNNVLLFKGGWDYWNGILVDGGSNNITIKNTTIEDMADDGIGGGGTNNIVNNVSIYRVSHSGISMSANYSVFSDIYMHTQGNAGVRFDTAHDNVVKNVTIENAANFGIESYNIGQAFYATYNITYQNISLLSSAGALESAIYFAGNNSADNTYHIYNITLKNIILDVKNESTNEAGIYIGNSNNIIIDNVVVNDTQGNGTYVVNNKNVISYITINNSVITESSGYGVNATTNVSLTIKYSDFFNNALGNFGPGISAGTGVIYQDPLFANVSSQDFHLKSQAGRWNGSSWVNDTVTSPLIDAGDPISDYSLEPAPNGGRINMGAYGNTPEASKSAAAITSWGNNKTSNDSLTLTVNTSETVRFNATANQTITTWNWYKDDVNQNNNFDNFTTFWSNGGTKTIKLNASNSNGTSNTVVWNVDAGPSFIFFTDPTPGNGTTISQDYAYINTTISDPSTTAFIDWNRSSTGWWRFNNEGGENSTFFRDWSSYENDGTCSGTSCPTSTSGKFGNALNFDGSDDYVTMPDSASLNPSNITVEAWFNAVSGTLAYQKSVVQKPYTSHTYPYYQYMLSLIDGGAYPKEADFYITINGVLYQIGANNLSFGYRQWHYLTGTYNGTNVALYLDGALVATQSVTGTINSYNTVVQIGAYSNLGKTSTYVFGGKIDEVHIHSRGLSPDEIKASYNAGIYRLYRNFTNLVEGIYNYKAYAQNFSGDVNQTETRILTQTSEPVPIAPANITSWGNNKTSNDSLTLTVNTSETVRFNATANQTITTWNWYKDDANQKNNFDNFTTSWSNGGTKTVKVNATNNNGTSNTVIWNVNVNAGPSFIFFTDPTPANGTTITQNYAYINTTISDPNTTAFIDWNRSITGWWRFNNESGENSAFFRDWSTWGNDGTCSGTSCPASTSGKFGKALNFDGSNDYVTMPDSASLNPSNITVEAWFNAVSGTLAYQKSIVQKPYTSHTDPYYQYMLSLVDSGAEPKEADFYVTINGVLYDVGNINLNYGYGQWHYLAGTYNGANVALYLDGVLVATQSVSGTINSYNTVVQIGAYPNLDKTSTYVFGGKIDEVRIHNRGLSPDEIKASYNAGIYRLYRNFTNLADGVYNYKAYAQNFSGNVNQTETRILTVSTP